MFLFYFWRMNVESWRDDVRYCRNNVHTVGTPNSDVVMLQDPELLSFKTVPPLGMF